MSSRSPSSIKSFYKAKIHNNNSTSSTSSSKRPLDSNNNHSVKIPRTFDGGNAVITLGDSDNEDSSIDRLASIRGVSTPSPGALSAGVDRAFNAPKEASKSNLFEIFFLISRNSEPLRSAFNSLSREVFNPCWINLSEVDEMLSIHKDPILVVDSFESDQFSHFKAKKELKIFSAFALLSINPRRPGDLTAFKHSRIASVCMKKVSITISGISEYKEIIKKVRAMGGSFERGLRSKTTHIISENWNSEKVKYFRKLNKPVMRPEWVHRCWEMKEDIRDLGELDKFALPVFSGMNICVSGFDQQMRTKMKKNVIEHGGNWQRGLMLGRYDFETEDTISTQIDKNMRTTHLVVATKTTDKYKSAMGDPDVKIVNVDWFNASLTNRVPQMEEDPKYCRNPKRRKWS